jgi:hypothetical protein
MKIFGIFITICTVVALGLTSCDSSSNDDDSPYLGISSEALTFLPVGGTSAVTIESNTNDWTSTLSGGEGWLTSEKTESGVKLTAQANEEVSGKRTASLSIVSAKAGITRTVAISQTSSFFLYLNVLTSDIVFKGGGGDAVVEINTNTTDWEFTIKNANWLSGEKVSGGLKLTATANENPNEIHATTVTISSFSAGVSETVSVEQTSELSDDGKPVGFVYFEDDFSWISQLFGNVVDEIYNAKDGGASVAGSINMYTGALAGSYAAGDMLKAFTAHGYYDIIPDAAGDYRVIYFCKDYLKFSKTNYQGGFYRRLTEIGKGRSVNVTYTFDALPVKGGTENYDDVVLNVIIEGPGSIGVDDDVTKIAVVDISNIETGVLPYEWRPDRDRKQVVLYGITADTKIIIKTEKEDKNPGTGSWYYRYYIDNIKFTKHSIH